jgi:hypothetical protein
MRSLIEGTHQLASLLVTNREIGHLQSAPAGLTLGQRQVTGGADNLAHASVAEEVWVSGRRLADGSVMRGSQRKHAYMGYGNDSSIFDPQCSRRGYGPATGYHEPETQ